MPPEESDVSAESSTAAGEDVKSQVDSSTTTKAEDTKPTQTVEDVIQKVFKSHSSSEKGESESGVKKSNATENEEEKKGEAEESEVTDSEASKDKSGEKEEGETEKKEVDKSPIPYERFAEVNSKKVELETRLEQLKPVTDAYESLTAHCTKAGIDEQQFNYWMEVAAQCNLNPSKAMEILQPVLQKLQGFTGDALPKDLAEMVENNEIPLAFAKRLAAAEANREFGQKMQQRTEQQKVQEKQQQYVAELTNSMNSWLGSRKTTDADFTPKSDQNAPDGKFEFFLHKFRAEAESANLKSAQELIALADRVYKGVSTSFEKFAPRKTQTKVLPSSRSVTNGSGAPKSFEDVIEQRAAAHGLHFQAPRKTR